MAVAAAGTVPLGPVKDSAKQRIAALADRGRPPLTCPASGRIMTRVPVRSCSDHGIDTAARSPRSQHRANARRDVAASAFAAARSCCAMAPADYSRRSTSTHRPVLLHCAAAAEDGIQQRPAVPGSGSSATSPPAEADAESWSAAPPPRKPPSVAALQASGWLQQSRKTGRQSASPGGRPADPGEHAMGRTGRGALPTGQRRTEGGVTAAADIVDAAQASGGQLGTGHVAHAREWTGSDYAQKQQVVCANPKP